MRAFLTLALSTGFLLFLAFRLVGALRSRKFVAVRLYLPSSTYDRDTSPMIYWAAIAATALVALALTFDMAVQIRHLIGR